MNKKMEFLMKVLKLFADYELQGQLHWECEEEDDPISLSVNCNDLFWWGSGDSEDITPENIQVLEDSIKDCKKIKHSMVGHGIELFAARVRKMRPQGCCYPDRFPENKKLWPLLDACGPKRKIDSGNPYKPGEYKT